METSTGTYDAEASLRWIWVVGGVLLGSALVSAFIRLVDPGLERPGAAAAVAVLSVVLVGILVGYRSRGETIRETAVAGLLLVILTGVVASLFLGVALRFEVWAFALFFVPLVAMVGGWVGEILQGTLEEAYEDRVLDWPWVFVSVVIGVTLSAYAVFLGQALLGLSTLQSLGVFAASFGVTGWIVGYASPGFTMVEPAVAALLMMLADGVFVILFFGELPVGRVFLVGFGGGFLLALLGGWLGEMTQRARRARVPPDRRATSRL